MARRVNRRWGWSLAVMIVALIVPAVALAKTTYWAGTVKYGVIDNHGDVGKFDINFNVSGSKVTYWGFGYACNKQASPGSENIPTSARIKNGKFKLNYTMPKGTNPLTHGPYDDPGFHVIITGQFTGGKASGTMDVVNDPLLGGACNLGTKQWHAHKTG